MIARLLISALIEDRANEIENILGRHQLSRNHPDLLYFEAGEKLGIEQARKIKEHFSLKPYSARGRVVVLEDASVMTVEAQNALLKTLEEPPEEAILILGAASEDKLLPTVLSRCEIVHLSTVIASEDRDFAGSQSEAILRTKKSDRAKQSQGMNDKYATELERLINASLEERFEYIEKLKEKEEFLTFMVSFFREKMLKNPSQEMKFFVGEMLEAEKWAASNVNIRAILEYLMLIMPKGE